MSLRQCPGCGARHESLGGPVPTPSLLASPECFAEQSELLAEFYQPGLVDHRQLVVDAYACTHPRSDTPRGVQATALSLMTMDLYLECGQPVADGSAMHAEMMRGRPTIFRPLTPPVERARLSARALLDAGADARADLALHWAREVWQLWEVHHPQIRAWNTELVPHRIPGASSR